MARVATGPATGAASTSTAIGPVVSVSVNGDASGDLAWSYQATFLSPLVSLEFDGTAAGIYFDRAHTGLGTLPEAALEETSFSGRPFHQGSMRHLS